MRDFKIGDFVHFSEVEQIHKDIIDYYGLSAFTVDHIEGNYIDVQTLIGVCSFAKNVLKLVPKNYVAKSSLVKDWRDGF